jgi:hypothetical protein
MSNTLLRSLIDEIKKAHFYAIIADEVTDSGGKQQLGICVRWVDENFGVQEDFIGLHELTEANATILTTIIKDSMLRLTLPLANCRGLCFDGASVMSGCNSGVATQLLVENSKHFIYIVRSFLAQSEFSCARKHSRCSIF